MSDDIEEVLPEVSVTNVDCDCDPHDPGNYDGCPHTNPELHPTWVDPNPLGVNIDDVVGKPIYGGIGENMNAPRRLVAMVELPDRRKETFQARNLLAESDIRDGMARAARLLHDRYMQRNYNAIGFVFDPDKIEYDFARLKIGMDQGADTQIKHTEGLARTLVATVVIRRPN